MDLVALGLGPALGAVCGCDWAAGLVSAGLGDVDGLGAAGVLDGFGAALGLVVASGFGLGLSAVLALSVVVALSAAADGAGVSDCVTQGPGLNGLLGSGSACARCGVKPMPISTAVGMAASATASPAGGVELGQQGLARGRVPRS